MTLNKFALQFSIRFYFAYMGMECDLVRRKKKTLETKSKRIKVVKFHHRWFLTKRLRAIKSWDNKSIQKKTNCDSILVFVLSQRMEIECHCCHYSKKDIHKGETHCVRHLYDLWIKKQTHHHWDDDICNHSNCEISLFEGMKMTKQEEEDDLLPDKDAAKGFYAKYEPKEILGR